MKVTPRSRQAKVKAGLGREKRGSFHQKHPWRAEHRDVVAKLVDMLTNPPILAYPDFDLPFILHTDVSNEGLGAVLYQRQDNKFAIHWVRFKNSSSCRKKLSPPLR